MIIRQGLRSIAAILVVGLMVMGVLTAAMTGEWYLGILSPLVIAALAAVFWPWPTALPPTSLVLLGGRPALVFTLARRRVQVTIALLTVWPVVFLVLMVASLWFLEDPMGVGEWVFAVILALGLVGLTAWFVGHLRRVMRLGPTIVLTPHSLVTDAGEEIGWDDVRRAGRIRWPGTKNFRHMPCARGFTPGVVLEVRGGEVHLPVLCLRQEPQILLGLVDHYRRRPQDRVEIGTPAGMARAWRHSRAGAAPGT